ncbi:MAG: WhiB family transcriptional regulator [Pseudonocardia sp.]|nr:WhiB family transcriptional regulator [Pseudonocardia sp.]
MTAPQPDDLQPPTFTSPACAEADPELWFPHGARSRSGAIAKRICSECVHRDECLAWALPRNVDGIWGGTSYLERRHLRRAQGVQLIRKRKAVPAEHGSEARAKRHRRDGEQPCTECLEAETAASRERRATVAA